MNLPSTLSPATSESAASHKTASSAAYVAAVAAFKELAAGVSLEGTTTTAGHRALEEIVRLKNVLAAAENTVLAQVAGAELEKTVTQLRAAGKKLPNTSPEEVFQGSHVAFRALHNTLATTLGRSFGHTRKHLRNARYFTGPLQQTLGAMWRGEISPAQVEHIAEQHYILTTTLEPAESTSGSSSAPNACTDAGPAPSHELETVLLETAADHPGASFGALARTLREQHHPNSVAPARNKARQDRFISITPQSDGMARIFGMLPVKELGELDQLLDTRTRSVLNRSTDTAGRTRSQIKADQFLDLLNSITNRATSTSRATTSKAHQVLVTIPVELFLAAGGHLPHDVATRLASLAPAPRMVGYGTLSPEEALDIAAATPTWETLLTHPVSGEMLALGRKRYRPPAKLRRSLQARDDSCRIPGCQVPATMCQVDHVTENQHGGTSDPPNLINLCYHHHQLKTAGKWQIEHATDPPDGSLKITLPDGTTKTAPAVSGFRSGHASRKSPP